MRYLITGIGGFVGKYFVDSLLTHEPDAEIYGIDIVEKISIPVRYSCINLVNVSKVEKTIFEIKPDYILHLAAMSSVASSWKDPAGTFKNNTGAMLNLLEAVRQFSPQTKILAVGSSDVYGNVSNSCACTEDMPLSPQSPYAVARVSQESLCHLYATEFGVHVIMSRSFNHFGPGQSERFALGSFMRQLVNIKSGKQREMHTGNLDFSRDFSDVRDVVEAYYLMLHNAKKGSIYNICSGRAVSLRKIVAIAEEKLNVKALIVSEQQKMRPNDIKCIYGSSEKIKKELGWKPVFSLEQTISDTLEWCLKNQD